MTTHEPSSVFNRKLDELRMVQSGQVLTARLLNEPRKAMNALLRGVTPPRQVPSKPEPSAGEPAIAVVLVEAPSLPDPPEDEGSSILKIRKVKYEGAPPMPPNYAWDGEAFDAYPAFGLKAGDFVGVEWLGGVPDVDKTTFLKARFVNAAWLVELPIAVVAQFIIADVHGDWMNCSHYDGARAGSLDVRIAKPYILRRTPWDGATREGVEYDYITDQRRNADFGNRHETQVILPTYIPGDLLYASGPIAGGTGLPGVLADVLWLDGNRDGREWAAEEEAPA